MTRIETFTHHEITLLQYVRQLLVERGIETIVKNDNIAIVGLAERASQDVRPELWVMDDTKAEEAASVAREVKEGNVTT